jgi:hypothetical protein
MVPPYQPEESDTLSPCRPHQSNNYSSPSSEGCPRSLALGDRGRRLDFPLEKEPRLSARRESCAIPPLARWASSQHVRQGWGTRRSRFYLCRVRSGGEKPAQSSQFGVQSSQFAAHRDTSSQLTVRIAPWESSLIHSGPLRTANCKLRTALRIRSTCPGRSEERGRNRRPLTRPATGCPCLRATRAPCWLHWPRRPPVCGSLRESRRRG